MQQTHTLMSCLVVPSIFSQPSKWQQLRILSISQELRYKASIVDITAFLTKFRPSALEDVTAHFLVVNTEILYAMNHHNSSYVQACLDFTEALSDFPRHRLSFLVSTGLPSRKHLWEHELGWLFPELSDHNRLSIDFESSERSN